MENNIITARGLAVITGADGGMGSEITRAVAFAGYRVIMASCRLQRAEAVRRTLLHERPDLQIEVRPLDLVSLSSVVDFVGQLEMDHETVDLLMNCAGTMET